MQWEIFIYKILKINMAKEKSLVEEAIIQMKNLEEAVAENAKGILASTMKEEIKELVKESLSEEEDEVETDVDVDSLNDEPTGNDEDDDTAIDNIGVGMDDTIDLTGEEDTDEVLKVFKLLGPEDTIQVVKDDAGNINIKDGEKEYMIVGESEDDFYSDDEVYSGDEFGDEELDEEWNEEDSFNLDEEWDDETDNENIEDIVSKVFSKHHDSDEDEFGKEYEMDEDMDMMGDAGSDQLTFDDLEEQQVDFDDLEEQQVDFDDLEEDDSEIVYEIEFDSEENELDEEFEDEYYQDDEFYGDESEGPIEESMKTVKPKGMNMGKPKLNIYSKNPNTEGGFKTVKKKVNTSMGTGSAKKVNVYKDDETLDGEMKPVKGKKTETKEAARTYGAGSKKGRGLRKAHTPNRNLTFENVDARELNILREKNEEYRKALNVFRNKLNEVAVFNSNLAYATRLFTEHSTSKQEKINILRRFDSVETIKESKNLYKTIKEELSTSTSKTMNESFERKIENVQSTGSAVNLIESKTYENPQFLRMKDLMSKLR